MPSDDIFARRDWANVQFQEIDRRLRGVTTANREVAKVRKDVEDLKSRFTAAGPTQAVLDELKRLDTSTKNIYLQVGDHGDRIRDLENSEAQRISFKDSEIDVAHQGEIETNTPWTEAFFWGLAGGLAGFFVFVVMMDVKNGWIGAVACFGIALFLAAHLLQKHQLKLAIQARHKWAYKDDQPPTAALPVADASTDANWWDTQPAAGTAAQGDAS